MGKSKQPHKPLNDLSRSPTPFDPNHTLIAVVELSQKNWLVAGVIPGVERQPLKKLEADADELLKLLERWRTEAEKAGKAKGSAGAELQQILVIDDVTERARKRRECASSRRVTNGRLFGQL